MRKLTLFLSVISMSLFLNSCLGTGDNNLSGDRQLFYITQTEDGVQVAHNGNFIMTSSDIKMQTPNRWYIITWSWTTENGMTGTNIHNAITPLVDEIPLGTFFLQSAPEEITIPVLDFEFVRGIPITEGFGDFIVFQYTWNKKEGEDVNVRLYCEATEIDATGNLVIDVRLHTPNSVTGNGKQTAGIAAVKVNTLRNLIDFGTNDYRDIQVTFRYYKTGTEKVTSFPYQLRVYKN